MEYHIECFSKENLLTAFFILTGFMYVWYLEWIAYLVSKNSG